MSLLLFSDSRSKSRKRSKKKKKEKHKKVKRNCYVLLQFFLSFLVVFLHVFWFLYQKGKQEKRHKHKKDKKSKGRENSGPVQISKVTKCSLIVLYCSDEKSEFYFFYISCKMCP